MVKAVHLLLGFIDIGEGKVLEIYLCIEERSVNKQYYQLLFASFNYYKPILPQFV